MAVPDELEVFALSVTSNNVVVALLSSDTKPGSGIYVSFDDGETWDRRSAQQAGGVQMVVDSTGLIFALLKYPNDTYGYGRSTDFGMTWHFVERDFRSNPADDDEGNIYITNGSSAPIWPEQLLISRDKGLTWDFFFPDSLPYRVTPVKAHKEYLFCNIFDPPRYYFVRLNTKTKTIEPTNIDDLSSITDFGFFDDLRAVGGPSGTGQLETTDGGLTWNWRYNQLFHANHFIIHGSILFAGANGGIYASMDSGGTWKGPFRDGIGNVNAYTYGLASSPTGFIYYAPTEGLYRSVAPAASASMPPIPQSPSISVYPNPAASEIQISATGTLSGDEVFLYNSAGKIVYSGLLHGEGGRDSFAIPTASLPNGTYFLRLRSGGGVKPVTVLH